MFGWRFAVNITDETKSIHVDLFVSYKAHCISHLSHVPPSMQRDTHQRRHSSSLCWLTQPAVVSGASEYPTMCLFVGLQPAKVHVENHHGSCNRVDRGLALYSSIIVIHICPGICTTKIARRTTHAKQSHSDFAVAFTILASSEAASLTVVHDNSASKPLRSIETFRG